MCMRAGGGQRVGRGKGRNFISIVGKLDLKLINGNLVMRAKRPKGELVRGQGFVVAAAAAAVRAEGCVILL